jgi:hypothetical protein
MPISREPIPCKLVATKSLQLMEQEEILERLLKTDDVHMLPAHVFSNLGSAARRAEPPDVLDKHVKWDTHLETD